MTVPNTLSHLYPDLALTAPEPLGLYLHVPFCRDRCTYCSFATTTDLSSRTAVVSRLSSEIEAWGQALARPQVDTLYVGGGTPSLLTRMELASLMGAARNTFDLEGLLEATVEANPGTVGEDWFRAARDLGFDRVSLGIQTLDDVLLRRLGRIHSAAQALEALDAVRAAGIHRISADLMLGIPEQNLDRVLADARTLVDHGAEHLSIYLLDLDKPCPLGRAVAAGQLHLPGEDAVADQYEALMAFLPTLGLPAYEISNHARPGAESRHNQRYWERRPYLGLGPSAASHLGMHRWTESADLPTWLAGTESVEGEHLSPEDDLAEIPMLGLRRAEGVDWEALTALAASRGLSARVAAWEKDLEPAFRAGLLVREGPRLRLTPKGRLLSNPVLCTFA